MENMLLQIKVGLKIMKIHVQEEPNNIYKIFSLVRLHHKVKRERDRSY